MTNLECDVYLPNLILWVAFGGQMGVASGHRAGAKGLKFLNTWGLKILPKSRPTDWNFWFNCCYKIRFPKFPGLNDKGVEFLNLEIHTIKLLAHRTNFNNCDLPII